jgi:GTP pyrophosphokinase
MGPLNVLVPAHPVLDAPVVRAAYAAAARAHAGQARKSGEPVLAHCLATAQILAELGLPEETVAAGLLHDALRGTRLTACQLEEHVPRSCVELVSAGTPAGAGAGVAHAPEGAAAASRGSRAARRLPAPLKPAPLTLPGPLPPTPQVEKVTRLSELSQLYRDNTHSLEAAAMLDMLTSMSDVSALLIKLADRLHNMRTIGALARCKQVRMATETLEVFSVLANRLGAWSVKAELEDLAFKTLQPEEYEQVGGRCWGRGAWRGAFGSGWPGAQPAGATAAAADAMLPLPAPAC